MSPFTFFTNFICNEARRRNNPGFTLSTVPTPQANSFNRFSTGPSKPERVERRSGYVKNHVSAHKTEVAAHRSASQSGCSDSKLGDVDRQCPIHQKPHPLKKLEVFGASHLKSVKPFLKRMVSVLGVALLQLTWQRTVRQL